MTPKYYEVLCNVHGTQEAAIKAYQHKSVLVGQFRNKRERYSMGCPACRAEKRAAGENPVATT